MKKLIFFIFLVQSVNLVSQDNTKPIIFGDIKPIWQHTVIDSTKFNDTIYNGSDIRDWGKNIFLGDTIAYFVFVDKSEDLQGGYIEKIDLKTGKLLWHNVFNIENSGKREYPDYVYINDNGNLEIVCFRNIQESFTLLWTVGQLSIREYDSHTGLLLNHYYNDSPLSDKEKLTFYPGKSFIYPNDKNEYIYYCPITTEDKYLYQLKRFDSDANLIGIDTVLRDKKYCCYTLQPINKIGNDTLLTARHQHNQSLIEPLKKENFDTFEFIVDIYTSSMDSLVSYDLKEDIPYNWSIYAGYDKLGYIVVSSKDSIKTNNTYLALSYFNMDGSLYETLDLKKEIPLQLFAKKLPNQEGILLVNRVKEIVTNNVRKIEIKKSDGSGNIDLLKIIKIKGERYVSISSLDILKNNQIIIGLSLNTYNPVNKVEYLVSFDGNELGLTGTQDISTNQKTLTLYPNPSSEKISINFADIFSGEIEILDIMGRSIIKKRLIGASKTEVNISDIPQGFYFVKTRNVDSRYKTGSFIKE